MKLYLFVSLTISICLGGCSASSSSFYHAQYGTLSPSSPVLDRELRDCASRTHDLPQSGNIDTTAGDFALAAIPVIREEDLGVGISKGASTLQAIRAVKAVSKRTLSARGSILQCMKAKGWTPVRK